MGLLSQAAISNSFLISSSTFVIVPKNTVGCATSASASKAKAADVLYLQNPWSFMIKVCFPTACKNAR